LDEQNKELSPHIRPIPTYILERDAYMRAEPADSFSQNDAGDLGKTLQ